MAGQPRPTRRGVLGAAAGLAGWQLVDMALAQDPVVDSADPANVAAAMQPNTKLVHVETPTNPMMKLCDIAAVAEIAHDGGALLGRVRR